MFHSIHIQDNISLSYLQEIIIYKESYFRLLPCMTFASPIPYLLKYNFSLCFLAVTLNTFVSVFGAITVLCGTINTLLRLCVVLSVIVTDFPMADCTTCTSLLQRLSVPFLNNDVSSTLTLFPGFKSVTNPFCCALRVRVRGVALGRLGRGPGPVSFQCSRHPHRRPAGQTGSWA